MHRAAHNTAEGPAKFRESFKYRPGRFRIREISNKVNGRNKNIFSSVGYSGLKRLLLCNEINFLKIKYHLSITLLLIWQCSPRSAAIYHHPHSTQVNFIRSIPLFSKRPNKLNTISMSTPNQPTLNVHIKAKQIIKNFHGQNKKIPVQWCRGTHSPHAMLHCLQQHNACKILNVHQGASKLPIESQKGYLGSPSKFP